VVRKKISRLGVGELEVLEMLWRDGPVNLSEAHVALGQAIGYTTVQTRLNRLVKKGVVKKSTERPARFRNRSRKRLDEFLLSHPSLS